MTQPRKEQISDERSYYTRIDSVGVTVPVPIGTPDVAGGTVQTIQAGGENYYAEFLASTITQVPGGAETDTPAFFFGAAGPFISPIIAGASFTITLPNINLGNPVLITFQSSDTVIIGGNPFISTSKVAQRINAALTAAGVSPLSPVAQNLNGKVVLTSAGPSGYTFGSEAFITVNDVTVGVCSALGFVPVSSTSGTALGVTSPVRGIITTSSDGQGGNVQLRLPDTTPAITQSNVQVNVSGLGNLPIYPPGQSIYGRLQQFPGLAGNPKFTISYVRQGAVPGKVVTNGGAFSTILTSDSFTVTVKTVNPVLFANADNFAIQTYVLNVTFGSAPTGPSDVITAVNAAWNAAALGAGFPAGQEAGRGGIQGSISGPWQFITGQDQFFITLNGNAPIKISPTTGVYSTQDLVAFINAAISTAGQAAQGSASGSDGSGVIISSSLTSGPSSTVQIWAGDLLGGAALPGNRLVTTLDKLGISPGVYSGSVIAKLYGADEIQFVCPDHTVSDPYGNSSGVIVSGSISVMAKLGLTGTSVTGNTSIGFEPVSPPIVQAMFPEMMYFGEVPDNIETTMDQFIATDEPNPVNPGTGTGNLGISPLLGLDGKINPDLINKVLDILNVDSLTLGARILSFLAGNQTPRLVTPFSSNASLGMTLLWQGSSASGLTDSGASQVMRLYADSKGGLWITTNASNTNPVSPPTWSKDPGQTAQSSSAIYVGQLTTAGIPKIDLLYAGPAVASPFNFAGQPGTAGTPPLGFDPSGALNGALAFIQLGTATSAGNENIIPRIQMAASPGDITLIWQVPPQTVSATLVPGIRIYTSQTVLTSGPSGPNIFITLNGFWNGTAWQKDVNGQEADAILLWQSGSLPILALGTFSIYYQAPTDDTPWTQWGTSGISSIPVLSATGINNSTSLGTLIPGANFLGPPTTTDAIPRIVAGGLRPGMFRALFAQLGNPMPGPPPPSGMGAVTRIYTGNTFIGSGGFGPGANDFTMLVFNAVWNPLTMQWSRDFPGASSTMTVWSGGNALGGNIQHFEVPSAASSPWSDSAWVCIASFSSDGLQVPTLTDTTNSVATPNLVNPASTVKAWANFQYQGNGTTTPTILVYDSWNCTVSTFYIFTIPVPEVVFHAGMANSNYAAIIDLQGLENGGAEVTPGTVSAVQSTGDFIMTVSDHTNATISWTSGGPGTYPLGTFSIAVFGRQ